MSDQYRAALGAYVLGALDGPERVELEAHLAHCHDCQDELVELAGLPGLLRQLSLADVTAEEPEPSTEGLAERALAELRQRRRADRRTRTLVLSAAAALVAVLVTGSFATGLIGDGWFEAGTTVTAQDDATHIGAAVRMKQEPAGTELVLTLWGVPRNSRCMLVAIARNGTRETSSTWIANYSGKAEIEGYTSISAADVAGLEIATPDGRKLLSIPVDQA